MDRILIVDDDREIRELLVTYLSRNGYQARAVGDGRAMWLVLEQAEFDLIILDLMLPGDDGLTLCRTLRSRSDIPVIMLTARGDDTDRIIGLELGADDYLPKPFNPRELLARIKVVLKRARSLPPGSSSGEGARSYRFAGWQFDLRGRQLIDARGATHPLTTAEHALLTVFCSHPHVVLSRDQLLQFTQGRETVPFERRIDVQVSRLRKRLGDVGKEPVLIKTVRNAGYVLAADVVEEA